jgi:acetyl esterase/lipase
MKRGFWVCLLVAAAWAEPRQIKDLVYSSAAGQELKLDLELPESSSRSTPLVLMIHGGSWSSGNRWDFTSPELVENGFAVATVDYRLAPDFQFPSNIQDVKAAVRFLRAHAADYQLDKNRFGAWGSSAGGHLVALLALAGPAAGWDVGDNLDQSSAVQAVVDWFGPTNFLGLDSAPASSRETVARAFGNDSLRWRQGSPLFMVHKGAPPFMIMHGRRDKLVPLQQSQVLHDSLTQAGVVSRLVVVENAGHTFRPDGGAPEPSEPKLRQQVVRFFQETLSIDRQSKG